MELLSKHTSKISKISKIISFIFLGFLFSSCSSKTYIQDFAFDTLIDIRYEANPTKINSKELQEQIEKEYKKLDKNLNFYSSNSELNKINSSNSPITVDHETLDIIQQSYILQNESLKDYFSITMGGINKLWKDKLNKETPGIPSSEEIKIEAEKIATTSLVFTPTSVQRIGDAKIDLGAVVKGYALDKINSLLKENEITNYVLDLGHSSIAIGGQQSVTIAEYKKKIIIKDSCITTSSIHEQKFIVGDKTYSHIINPKTYSAIPYNDQVIVINDNPFLADACSTALMNISSFEEIKKLENDLNIKTIIFKDGGIVYSHQDLTLFDA